jgi:hypothetical protein
MASSREDISIWFDRGVEQRKTHMAVVCDTFDWEDYPVYFNSTDEAKAWKPGEMQKLMEVYALHLPKADQMAEHRSFHYETPN